MNFVAEIDEQKILYTLFIKRHGWVMMDRQWGTEDRVIRVRGHGDGGLGFRFAPFCCVVFDRYTGIFLRLRSILSLMFFSISYGVFPFFEATELGTMRSESLLEWVSLAKATPQCREAHKFAASWFSCLAMANQQQDVQLRLPVRRLRGHTDSVLCCASRPATPNVVASSSEVASNASHLFPLLSPFDAFHGILSDSFCTVVPIEVYIW